MKKTMSILLAAAMCLSMGVNVFADNIEARSPSCDECGGTTHKVYEEIDTPMAPCRCEKCGDKTFSGTLTIYGYQCYDCGEFTEINHFVCYNCQ